MAREPSPSPRELEMRERKARERDLMKQITKGIIKKGETPKPKNIRRPPPPPPPPKKTYP